MVQRIDRSDWPVVESPGNGPPPKRGTLTLRSVAAAAGIFSGIASLFVGLVCVAVHLLMRRDQMFDRVGSVLLISAIPLMLAGSLILDESKGRGKDV